MQQFEGGIEEWQRVLIPYCNVVEALIVNARVEGLFGGRRKVG